MANDFKNSQNSEDAQAVAAEAQRQADEAAAQAAADESARVEAEKAAADAAAVEADNQDEAPEDPRDELVQVVLDPDFAEALGVDSAVVGTAAGEYELSATPVDVAKRDLDNVLASPAAKEAE